MAGAAGGQFDFWTGQLALVAVCCFWLRSSPRYMLFDRWGAIRIFALGDTDDNMRIMQVRALLAGQGWYDLAQHRLAGSNIHWSRLVDLPIAGLKLLFTPFFGGRIAEQIAVAVAPLLPMLVAMAALAVDRAAAGRARSPIRSPSPCSPAPARPRGMWQPLRIDHHGWQLAMLAWSMASLTDRNGARAAARCSASPPPCRWSIGMEMLLYLAVAGAITVLMWVRDAARRGGCSPTASASAAAARFGFLVFASEANRRRLCDALSPVWLSAMVGAGAVAVLLAWLSAGDSRWRGFGARRRRRGR